MAVRFRIPWCMNTAVVELPADGAFTLSMPRLWQKFSFGAGMSN